MKAESHTMTLKTKQHSWPRGVQFFRKHIMSGMWTRAWLLLFCLCFFLFFFYFEIVRVVHRRWTQCQTARLDLCTNILQGKGTFSTSENGGKNRKVFWAYHHNLCLSPIFLFFLPNLSLGEVVRSWHSGDSAWITNKHKVVRTVSAGWLEAVYALYDCTRRQPWRV